MPINYPANRKEVADRIKTDIKNLLPDLDPNLRDSFILALATGDAGRIYDLYMTIKALENEMFPDTSTGTFLDRWGSYKNLTRNQATQSLGRLTITGIDETIIPIDTIFQTSDGLIFHALETKTITSQILIVQSITRSGSVATVTTVEDHHFASGNTVTISGADQTEYNIAALITVTGLNTFTYLISGTPITPATTSSTLQASLTFADIEIQSIDYGEQTNLDEGTKLLFTTPIAGADISAFVQYEGTEGGLNLENDEDFRKRILYAYQHPISYFNVAELTTLALTKSYVTRVNIQEITPTPGCVTIYFLCDKQTNIIPTAEQVNDLKTLLLTIKPAHVDPNDLIVLAPTAKIVNFVFSNLTPNTQTMQDAIRANLKAMFSEVPIVGENLSKYSYQSAIYQSVDPTTGEFVTGYSLITPVNDILVNSNEIAILGTITF